MALDLNLKGLASKLSGQNAEQPVPENPAQARLAKPGLSTVLSGETNLFVADLKPFLPSEVVGGAIPHIPGSEEEAVWNAASQACATEKVHYSYTIADNKVWYLACPSSALASSPDSWCPLAAALPGNSEYWDRETVYIYEQEGLASALRWDKETGRMQIYLGASRSILPRIQSMEANFVTINPDTAKIVPWKNRQLMTEQLSRATARMLIVCGILISMALLGIMAVQYISINLMNRNLDEVKTTSETASADLMLKASQSTQSDILKNMVRVQELLDDLSKIDGTLVKYEVKAGAVEWEALVPAAYSTGVMSVRGQAQPGIEPDGRIRLKGTQ